MYYHGTKSNFSQFTRPGSGQHGIGFYFTKEYNDARAFAYNLAGDGSSDSPKVYSVNLTYNNLFNTMDTEQCKEICRKLGLTYKTPEFVGGPKEHYYYLAKQLKKNGISENLNATLFELGYDGVFYEFMEHVIVFKPEQITIIKVDDV